MKANQLDATFYDHVHAWHDELKDKTGVRAQLRRCRDEPLNAVFHEGYQELLWRISDYPLDSRRKAQLCYLAVLLAHVKQHDPGSKSVAATMAIGEHGSPRVSKLRFRRLLSQRDTKDLHHALVRMLPLLKGSVNVKVLAKAVMNWGDKLRRQWAQEYYEQISKTKK